jgi:HEAT repeat protein
VSSRTRSSIALIIAGLTLSPNALAKKPSLAELAALEWKLEQGSTTLTTNADAAARAKAVAELAALKDPRAQKPLATALREDPDPKIRLTAAEALAALRTPEAKGLLTLAAGADPSAEVRGRAAELLKPFPRKLAAATLPLVPRTFKPPKAVTGAVIKATLAQPSGDARLWALKQVPAQKELAAGATALLEGALKKDPSARVRVEAARSLAVLGKQKSLPTLIRAIEDGDPQVRFELATLIAEFDDPGVLTVLQKLAASDANATVKAEARDLLEPSTAVGRRLLKNRIQKLRSAGAPDRLAALGELAGATHWRAMLPMSCALLGDKSREVRAAAAKTLADMHDTTVLSAMRIAAELEPDKKLQATIRGLLVGMRKKVDALVAQLKATDPGKRVLAARALGQGAYGPGLAPLIAALKDSDPKVRLAVVNALVAFADPKAQDALKLAGTDADAKVRKAVDRHFKEQQNLERWRSFYKDPNRLVMKTTDKDPVWRFDAAIALGVMGAEAAVGNLAQLLLHDKEESVRHAAAWALVLMGSDRGENALKVAASKDPSERLRLTARKYLVIDKVSVDDLVAQLDDEKGSTRTDAAEALSLRATGKALNPLIRTALCDSEAGARSAALRGLARIGNPIAKGVIRVALTRDADKRVRRTAMVMHILTGGEKKKKEE